jgi:glycosyltransferase involved in cell wall biosynthesis
VDDLWPEVFYELGYVKSKGMRKALDFVAWFSYTVPAAITPISEGYKHVIVSKYGVPSEKVHVIEVGVETIKSVNVTANSYSGCFTVMYSGVLGLGYDFDIVLESAQYLQSNTDIIFVIRGIGEESRKLEKAIHHFGLKNIILDTRYLTKTELDALLKSADVFVLPMAGLDFVEEGLPTKVFEYQSYGKPILCISKGEAAKYIEKTKSGLVIKPKNIAQFVDAVKKLYINRQLGVDLGMNGREYVSNLTSDEVGEKMYNELIAVQ